jgi:putative pyruvate formate lyase activating enzyme
LAGSDPWQRHRDSVQHLHAAEAAQLMSASAQPDSPGVAGIPDAAVGDSLIDLKLELAGVILDACDLCPHHCLVNRNAGKVGYCGVSDATAVHWEGILHGEEIELVPSHEVFLSGCTMRCAFCYSHEHITRPMSGRTMTTSEIKGCVEHRQRQGATNLNLVGGEPIVHLGNILRVLKTLEVATPVVWNSNMYATPATMELLDGIVDLYLGDIHFGNESCAARLGRVPAYVESVQTAFVTAAASGASVIIRHLVMPGHLECCARPAMQWAVANLPAAPFHLMFQYVPDYRAENDPVLGRPLSQDEIRRARDIALEVGVHLYKEEAVSVGDGYSASAAAPGQAYRDDFDGLDGTVDIFVHDDGRVSFKRLLSDLVPIAAGLNGVDERVLMRAGGDPA